MRILKCFFNEPKIRSTTFLADAWRKLNNSSQLAGLYSRLVQIKELDIILLTVQMLFPTLQDDSEHHDKE